MISIFNNISLKDRNSFHVDVKARELIEYSSAEDLIELFKSHTFQPSGWMVLSGGNNTLFTKDVEQTILTPTATEITTVSENPQERIINVSGGVEWDDVVEWCVERNLWGIENLSLIPGKACAAPIQNIGAYGVEVCDVILEVEFFDPSTLTLHKIGVEECKFGYRESIFKHELRGKVIVTSITLRLSKIKRAHLNYADVMTRVDQRGGETLRNIRDAICEIRREKLPDTSELGNAGSFFKNPIVDREVADGLKAKYEKIPIYMVEGDESKCKLAAGWLIDQAGMKGYRSGCVGVHSRQALVLVNYGEATGEEIVELARYVQRLVKERFNVDIDCEVNIL